MGQQPGPTEAILAEYHHSIGLPAKVACISHRSELSMYENLDFAMTRTYTILSILSKVRVPCLVSHVNDRCQGEVQ